MIATLITHCAAVLACSCGAIHTLSVVNPLIHVAARKTSLWRRKGGRITGTEVAGVIKIIPLGPVLHLSHQGLHVVQLPICGADVGICVIIVEDFERLFNPDLRTTINKEVHACHILLHVMLRDTQQNPFSVVG